MLFTVLQSCKGIWLLYSLEMGGTLILWSYNWGTVALQAVFLTCFLAVKCMLLCLDVYAGLPCYDRGHLAGQLKCWPCANHYLIFSVYLNERLSITCQSCSVNLVA